MTRALAVFVLVIGLTALPGCSNQEEHFFSIESGPAMESLEAFANQSGENVVIDDESVKNIITNEVYGKMTSENAVRLLLSDTELKYSYDEFANLYRISQNKFSKQ